VVAAVRGGQLGGIAKHQWLAGLHRHQQRPRRYQWPLFAHDVRRSLDPVDPILCQHAQVIDEVAGTFRKFHELLRRLYGLPGGQVAE